MVYNFEGKVIGSGETDRAQSATLSSFLPYSEGPTAIVINNLHKLLRIVDKNGIL